LQIAQYVVRRDATRIKYALSLCWPCATKTGRKFVAFLSNQRTYNMKSMLILTDFSEAAFRAAEYACELAGALHIERILLYHAYQTVVAVPGDTVITDDQQLYLESMEAMGMWHDRLKPMVARSVTIDLLAEDIALDGLAALISQKNKKEGIDMIVMGVSGKSGLEKIFLGSTTTAILNAGELPVLIVPQDILLGRGITTVVFTSDLRETDAVPADQLHGFLDALGGKLSVVNVGLEAAEKYSPETEKAIASLHQLLEKYDPVFNYIKGDDIVKDILAFAGQQHASLIIAVHQKHGFWSGIFHKSITRKLAYNSRIPLLSLPGLK
jgi:nucleotide-binding universal stress UspA family protein